MPYSGPRRGRDKGPDSSLSGTNRCPKQVGHWYTRIYQTRTYSSKTYQQLVHPPDILTESNLLKLFDPLVKYIEAQRKERRDKNRSIPVKVAAATPNIITLKEQIVEIGAKVKVKWSQDEIGGQSGWRPGWYTAYVQRYDEVTDLLTV